ncbi:hypothetical protein ACVSUB_13835 [Yersinia enterocolitica]
MNKKEWLEAALRKIDSMSRDEFEAALQRAAKPLTVIEPSVHVSASISNTFDVSFSSEVSAKTEIYPFENQWLSLPSKKSRIAPQEVLYPCLAA